MSIGDVALVIEGYILGLGVDPDIHVFGASPENYTVNITGLEAEKAIEYIGAPRIRLH